MRKILFAFISIALLNICSSTVFGQDTLPVTPARTIADPLFLLNSVVIINGYISHINTDDVKGVTAYKYDTAPAMLKNLAADGIIVLTYDKHVKSKSFTEIGKQYKLRRPISFVLNGKKLDDVQAAKLRIVPEAIGRLCIEPATSKDSESVVSIQLKANKPASGNKAPGTIMIR
ncbi:hypothetical protein GCM10027346_02700 [Hymenobacter seoulensis]